MHTTEHTDLDGDALTVHHDKGLAWVTITRGGDELTVGPVPAHALTGQHRSSHMRDEKRNAGSRPLTPDAITDEMLLRALIAHYGGEGRTLDEFTDSGVEDMRDALTAALTVPPARPEGAEDIERVLRDYGINDGEQDFADFLAQRGVRVVTKETSR